ncbi:MAG: alpha/beta hydrolase [Proteobacteria bacterium]|nr:alpha/beta hydrolase [Pseudomonadota bacterium]
MAATRREVVRREWRLDVSDASLGADRLEIAASSTAPADLAARALRSLTRRYYDLWVGEDASYSFAEAMARRGFATLAIDHLGVGESSRPEDGWRLDADRIAAANQRALDAVRERLAREGDALASVPLIGVGHSMGSCLTVVQQADHAPYAALVLFTFQTLGLPAFLEGGELAVAGDPEAIRARIVELARARFGAAYPQRVGGAEGAAFSVGSAPPAAVEALQTAAGVQLPIPGLLSMLPGGYSPWAEKIRVPALIPIGDHDLPGTEEESAASLPNAARVDTFVQDDCWHCHFVSNTRASLWTRVADWIDATLQRSA